MRLIAIVTLASLTTLAIVVTRDQPTVPSLRPSPAIGKPAPLLDLITLTSTSPVAHAKIDLGGNVTLLHLWGTWCGPCRMEYPQLSQAAEKLSSHPHFQFISVSCEGRTGETFEGLWIKTNDFFQSQSVDSAAYADPRGLTRRSLVDRLDQTNLCYPTSVLIDAQGNIAGVWQGFSEDSVCEITAMANRLVTCDPSNAGYGHPGSQ